MSFTVKNITANADDMKAHAARVIGKSTFKRKVFEAIYNGKKKQKTKSELMAMTRIKNEVRLLQECNALYREELIERKKINGEFVFIKIPFYSHHKNKILNFKGDKVKIRKFLSEFKTTATTAVIKIQKSSYAIKQITVNEIDSFVKVRNLRKTNINSKYPEQTIKKGIQKIIGQTGVFKDWGGEINDLYSTNLKYSGRRLPVAFAFKGKATKGKLTPKSLGKNGDQIQRLFESPAELFIVLYQGEIDQSVIQQMEKFAIVKSISTGKKIFYCVIDKQDTDRIITAYKSKF